MYHTVTNLNFCMLFPQIEKLVKNSTLLSLHAEFNGTAELVHDKYSSSDCELLYQSLRNEVENLLIFQFALCVFVYNSDTSDYSASIYRFYLHQKDLHTNGGKKYSFKSSYIDKLCNDEFDFNEFGYQGISCLTIKEENSLRSRIKDGKFLKSVRSYLSAENQDILQNEYSRVAKWYNADIHKEPFLKLVPQWKTRMDHILLNNLLAQEIKQCFCVSTVFNSDEIMITRIPHNRQRLPANHNENIEQIIELYSEFSKVIKLITNCKKPLVGYDVLISILGIFLHSYESLPESYIQFKEECSTLFESIYDIKYIASQFHNFIPKEDIKKTSSVESLYNYLRKSTVDGDTCDSLLNENTKTELSKYLGNPKYIHEVGFRSFIHGYCFIKMIEVISELQNIGLINELMNADKLKAMQVYRNRICVEFNNIQHVNLERNDDVLERRPLLHVSKKDKTSLDTAELYGLCSRYSCVDFTIMENSVIISVGDANKFHDLFQHLQKEEKLDVTYYNTLKHFSIPKHIFWYGALGALMMSVFVYFKHQQ